MKVSAIFSDYDGTLAPEDVSIESSRLPKEIENPLKRLSSMIPIAIVTSKSFCFISPKTPFARAWACVSGLEIVLSTGRAISTSLVTHRLRDGLEYAKRYEKEGMALELKRSRDGKLLGFSMDWRRGSSPSRQFVKTATDELAGLGLTVVHDPEWAYLDVFGARPNKGTAVIELRKLLNVRGNVIFMGDSTADNPAFAKAEVAVCVEHGQNLKNLTCRFVVRYGELGGLLSSLADSRCSLDLYTLGRK